MTVSSQLIFSLLLTNTQAKKKLLVTADLKVTKVHRFRRHLGDVSVVMGDR